MTIEDRPGARRPRRTAHGLARYEALFAARTRKMRSSAMRDMFALTERPEVISLAGGLPDTSTFSPELYARLMAQVAATSTARALQYGPTEGMAAAKECVVEVMAAEGTVVDPEDLIVTTGGQQVIDLVCKTLIDPGDVIIAEAPTYPGAIPAFTAYEANVVQVGMDSEGMSIDELAATLERLERGGRRPKLIYTIPNFQNPGGATMSLERRRHLVALARERELLVLEDNPYGLLRYEGESLPTLYSLDASREGRGGASELVIYLGTFSKILSPGIRLGWAVAPRPVLEKLNLGKQGTDLCSSPVSQLFVCAYFAERAADGGPAWRRYVESLRDLYRGRRDVMLEALDEHFGERADWTRPEGGLFVWVTLEDGIDTTDLQARSERVAFVPGRAAYVDGRGGQSSMRLNFAGSGEREIREGIRRISEVMGGDSGLIGALRRNAPAVPAKRDDAGARAGARRSDARAPTTEAAGHDPGPDGASAVEAGADRTRRRADDAQEGDSGLAEVVELPQAREASARRRRSR